MASPTQIAQGISALAGIASGIAQNLGGAAPRQGKFSISKMTSTLNQFSGLYKSHHFAVSIDPPAFLRPPTTPAVGQATGPEIIGGGGSASRLTPEALTMLCNSASLPGKQILASDHRRQGYGTFDRRAWGASFTDIPLTFFMDGRGEVSKFFYKWQAEILATDTTGGPFGETNAGAMPYEAAYHQDYSTTMTLTTYDVLDNTILTYRFVEAWPFQVGDVTVAWAENDQFSLLPVQMTYRSYTLEQVPGPRVNDNGRGFNLAGALGLIAGAAGIVASGTFSQRPSIANFINTATNLKTAASSFGFTGSIAPPGGADRARRRR